MPSPSPELVCPPLGTFPSVKEFRTGLGEGPAIAVYTCSVLVFLINIAMFIFLILRFIKSIPSRQIPSHCWVVSLPSGLAFTQLLLIFLPGASDFLLLVYSVYEAVVIYKFVDLNLMWFGGEKALINAVGQHPVMRFNLPPCCCCFVCWSKTMLTRTKLRFVRLMVSQMLYTQIFVIFMQQVLHYNNVVSDELYSSANPSMFLNIFGRVSFLAGFWGLFVFFNIDYTFKLFVKGKFKTKFMLMKTTLFMFIIQETLMEVLVFTDTIPCYPYLSRSAMSNIIMSCSIMVECTIIGVLNCVIYYRYPTIECQHTEGGQQTKI